LHKPRLCSNLGRGCQKRLCSLFPGENSRKWALGEPNAPYNLLIAQLSLQINNFPGFLAEYPVDSPIPARVSAFKSQAGTAR